MKNIELQAAAITWLEEQSCIYKTRPNQFTPKQVAEAVGGAYTALGGDIADLISIELTSRGIPTRYVRIGSKRYFELF